MADCKYCRAPIPWHWSACPYIPQKDKDEALKLLYEYLAKIDKRAPMNVAGGK